MKSDLQKLIDTAKLLCDNLDKAAKKEKEVCEELENEFEKMSWELFRISEDLKLIREYKQFKEEAC